MIARNASIGQLGPPDEQLVEILSIEGNLSGDFALARPVRVEVWVESGALVADIAEFNVHALGASREEALADLRGQIVEQRQRLLTVRDGLSRSMRQEAALLEATVLPRHAQNGVAGTWTITAPRPL